MIFNGVGDAGFDHWTSHYIKVPYKPLGLDLAGFDCVGMAALIQHEQYKRPMPELEDIDVTTKAGKKRLAKALLNYFDDSPFWQEVDQLELKESDVVLTRKLYKKRPCHIATYLEDDFGGLFHTLKSLGVCFTPLEDLAAMGLIVYKCYRYNND